MPYKIAVIGPESSGKTTLCRQLARHYQAPMVEEFARSYLSSIGTNYKKHDLDQIAQGQINLEKKIESKEQSDAFIFYDTNLLVIKIWSELKYGDCSKKITDLWQNSFYDLHLLLNADLPYEKDPLRESPKLSDRKLVFEQMENELQKRNANYFIIEGKGENRLKNAIEAISNHFFL